LRTFAEQDALYAQGRTRSGNIVTNAKAGHSNHNYGLALDFVLIKGGYDMKADDDHDGIADWLEVVAIAKLFGFEWGGDWITFKDNPHIEMTFGLSIKDLLAGKRPTDKQIGAVITKIQKWELEEKEMADVQLLVEKIEVQNDIITSMEKRLAAVEKRLNISGKETYADQYKEAVEAAKAAKIITTVADKSKIELNIIQMLYNAGVIPKIKK
jgi:peptidoglycan L-alanyl-D-glutamate endopeptidase CwlK